MKQFDFPKFKKYTGQAVRYIQPKLDGHLTKVYRDDNRTFTILTKNDKHITDKLLKIKHIREELIGLPENSCIFAELHCPSRFATDVPTMLNAADEDLRLTAFAAPMIRGEDLSDSDLHGIMIRINREFGIDATCADKYPPKSFDETARDKLLNMAISRKWEGHVLKESHMFGWYKLKPTKTVDCFVIGTCESFSAQHLGGLKSIVVAVWKLSDAFPDEKKMINLGNVGSGFTAEFRASLNTKDKRHTLIDKVCEVEYDSLASNGKLRFPRFLKWRTDKDKSQCTTEQFE